MAYDFTEFKKSIIDAREHLAHELANIRTGRATPTLLDGIKPDVYGTRTPLTQLASVSIEDARTLRIIAWDKDISKNIEKAIIDADLGVSVSTDDSGLRVIFPTLTTERRALLNKLAGEKLEHAKVSIRSHRSSVLHELESDEKEKIISKDDLFRYKEEIQKIIDSENEQLEGMLQKKQREIAL